MKKIILTILSLFLITLSIIIFFLATKGYETDQFNNFISSSIENSRPNLKLKLKKIKIKLDVKNLSIFLSTKEPIIYYNDTNLSINETKVYVDFLPIIKSDFIVKKIYVDFKKIELKKLKKIILTSKPSNLKSFILNNDITGSLKSKIELNFEKNSEINSYFIDGFVEDIEVRIKNKFTAQNLNLEYKINKKLIVLNNVKGQINDINIEKGLIEIKRGKEKDEINGQLFTKVNFNEIKLKKLIPNSNKISFLKNKINIKGNLKNNFNITFDKTLKIKEYNFNIEGTINRSNVNFVKPFNSEYIKNRIKNIYLDNLLFKYEQNSKNKKFLILEGKYKVLKDQKFNQFKIETDFKKTFSDYNINLDVHDLINIDFINYNNAKKNNSNIQLKFLLFKDRISIKKLIYKENKTNISAKDLKIYFKDDKFSFDKIKVKTFTKENYENNNFEITFNKLIKVIGSNYDSSKLFQKINNNKNNSFKKLSEKIEISLDQISTKSKDVITNFNLIGLIEGGSVTRVSSKGELADNQYLDLSLKKDKKTNITNLEIYSDIPKLLLSNFKQFNSIEEGNLLYNSTFDKNSSKSKILIENFKVKDAPGFMRLLSLADLGGMADLVSGNGLSFDTLEINYKKEKNIITLEDLYAVGPSVSILMEGYMDINSNLISFKGTMVPAKELNKLISKIPVIGKILIPQEVGEGLFGVSFKIKGMPGKVKTSVNPIKTLTPRFITRALEKKN